MHICLSDGLWQRLTAYTRNKCAHACHVFSAHFVKLIKCIFRKRAERYFSAQYRFDVFSRIVDIFFDIGKYNSGLLWDERLNAASSRSNNRYAAAERFKYSEWFCIVFCRKKK